MKIRARLLLLVGAVAAPLVLFAAGVVVLFGERESDAIERGLRDTARALALTIDREIDASIAALTALGASEHLEAGDYPTFYEEAQRVQAAHGTWPTVFLIDRTGQEIFSLLVPLGSPLPNVAADPDVAEALRTGVPIVSNLMVGPVTGRPVVRIHVPVGPAGGVRYVVATVLTPRHFAGILARLPMSPRVVSAVLDRSGTTVARSSAAADGWIDRAARPELLQQARADGELFASPTVDGARYHVAFAVVPRAQFVAAVGLPRSAASARSFWAVAGITAVLLVVAVLSAVGVADHIRRPILDLADCARSLGRGEACAERGPSGLAEADVVRGALVEAAAKVQERAREHEERLAADAGRREAEAAARTLQDLVELTEAGLRHLELQDLLQDLVARLRRALRADTATILLLPEDGQTIHRVASDATAELADQADSRALNDAVAGQISGTEGVIVDDLARERLFRPERQPAVASLVGAPLTLDGRVIGVVHLGSRDPRRFTEADLAFVRLVANRVAIAVDRARVHELARRARDAAEIANRTKDQFLAMLGHELRNPLATIINATQMLSRAGERPEGGDRAREIITRQVRQLARLVDDLLDVSRVMAGKVVLDRRRLDLGELARHSIESLRLAGRLPDHTVEVEAVPVWVEADELRVTQVIENLLTNALKYTPRGGRILVAVAGEGRDAVLRVSDSGIGIPAELLSHVFDLFVQGPQPLGGGQGGLGIGLSVVRRLVELHGGTVAASSEGEGAGSVFTVRLPRA